VADLHGYITPKMYIYNMYYNINLYYIYIYILSVAVICSAYGLISAFGEYILYDYNLLYYT